MADDEDVLRVLTSDRRSFDDARVYALMAEWGVSPGRFARLVVVSRILNAMETASSWTLAGIVGCLVVQVGCVVVLLSTLAFAVARGW